MKDYIYEENGKWCHDEWLEPESRGWVTHSFDTKEQAESYRDERENPALAKMAGGDEKHPLDCVKDALESAYDVFSDKRFTDRHGNAAECREAIIALHEYIENEGRVDGLAEAICFFEDCTNDLPQQYADYMHSLLESARIQLKRQEG